MVPMLGKRRQLKPHPRTVKRYGMRKKNRNEYHQCESGAYWGKKLKLVGKRNGGMSILVVEGWGKRN